MSKVRGKLSEQSGQIAVMFMLVMLFFVLLSIVVVDFGLWFGDRRDAQNDADQSALAGALSIQTLNLDDPIQVGLERQAALTAAIDWADANNVDVSGCPTPAPLGALSVVCAEADITLVTGATCYPNDPEAANLYVGVETIVHREPASFFLGALALFGLDDAADPEVRTRGLACAGVPVEFFGFLPFTVQQTGECFTWTDENADGIKDDEDTYTPKLGELCEMQIADNVSGAVGQLGFDESGDCQDGNSGAAEFADQVSDGVQTACLLGDDVASNQGNNVGAVRRGLTGSSSGNSLAPGGRLYGATECDTRYTSDSKTTADLLIAEQALTDPLADPLATPPGLTPLGAAAFADWDGIDSPNKRPLAGDGIDDFFEVWDLAPDYDPTNPAKGLIPRECTSPRNVQIIVIFDVAQEGAADGTTTCTNNCWQIRAVNRMYIEGCSTTSVQTGSADDFEKTCTNIGGGPFYVYGRFVEQIENIELRLGIADFGTVRVFLKE